MEEDKSKEEDAVKLFLEIFEPANASLPSRKDIKSFQDLITFSDKYDATKQQTDTESIWQTNQDLYVTTVLGLRIEKRTLGWKALIAILNYLNNSINLRAEFFNKCQAILDYLQSNCEKVSDRDYNVTLFCLNILENYRKAATDQRPSFSKSKALVEFVKNVLKICHRLAFTQSSATLTSFKCLTTIIEVSRKTIDAKDEFFDVCCRNEQLDIIMSNWENPNPAVRKLVKELFAGWLTVEDKCYHKKAVECDCSINALRMDLMEHIMKSITWKHSFEFRILVAMFDSISFNETRSLAGTREEYFIKIKDGLLLSLKSHELASSGAELFDKLFTCIEWIKWFHDPIKDYLCSDNRVFITNIIKYWMPVILKKFRTYTLLDYLLTRDSAVENRTSLWYLSAIKMLRIKRKRGNFYHLGEFGQIFLQRCLTCSDEDVRCDAFAALCETSTGLEPWEYQLVKQFLVENVNYDRANLRQNMVNCCVSFFLRVRGSKIAKRNKYSTKSLPSKQVQEHDKEVALNFVEDLHQFLIENLQTHCNYQRKMTSLMLYNAVLIYFGVGGGREKDQRKSNTKDKSGVIEEQATKAGKWNFRSKNDRKLLFACIDDISDSVRFTASDLLMNHFKWDKEDQEEINNFYKLGKEMCSSRLFYKIESGALLIKTVTIIAFKSDYSLIVNMLKNSNPIVFNETIIPNVTNDLILLAKRQLSVVSKDIFMASVQGHPLHGVLKALLLLLTDKTQFNYKESLRNVQVKDILNESNGTFANFSNKLTNYYHESKPESCDQLEEILNILEKTVKTMIALLSFNQYDPPEDVAFSPSFAEMGKSLEEIVKQSEISNNHDDEVLMLSVPHQLVLNCIWFNLKICCQFASGLITSGMVANSKAGSCARCFAIIETVLNKCRHKGAIDVAGSSMFSAANAVMEEPDKFSAEERNLPTKILDDFLKNMRSNSGCSLSRRSAGRSFLVHSIVASDPQPNSPLLSKTLSRLIEIIYEDQTQTELSLVDSPQVNALHILSTLLQDTRLNVLPYAKEIFCVCFEKLSSPIYTVKNAALQLFKSWLMRLMRRMKGESVMNETDNHQTTPLEELYRHMPQLFSFIEKKLDSLSSETDINSHAKLVPILVFLSNISITFFKEYNESYKKFSENVRDCVGRLLSSRVLFVRKLSARINSNMLLIHELSTEINSTAIRIEHAFLDNFLDQNLLHGLVMNLKYLSARLISYQREINPSNPNLEIEREAENVVRQCLITLIKSRQTCYFVKSLALDVINLWTPTFTVRTNSSDSLTTIKSSIVHYKPQLGSSLWLEKVVRNICIKDTSPDLKRFCLLGNTVSDVALACLRGCDLKPEEDSELVLEVFKSRRHPEVIHHLLKKIQGEFVFNDLKLLNFIYDVIVKKSKDEEFQCIDKGLGMLLICKILSSLSSDEFFSSDLSLGVLNCLCVWSSSSQMNENWRSVASECVICFRGCFLKKMFTKILIEEEVFDQKSDKLGSLLWKTLFNLLQDENLEIRLKACEFFPGFYLTSNVEVPNPFVALRKLVGIQFMLQIMNLKTAIDQLWTVLSSGSVIESIEMSSPYDHGIDNFYKDETWLRKVIHSELKSVCDKSIFCRDYLKERYKYTISS